MQHKFTFIQCDFFLVELLVMRNSCKPNEKIKQTKQQTQKSKTKLK